MTTYAVARAWCLAQPAADEAFPFGAEAAVFRVAEKMFAILVDAPPRISLHFRTEDAPLDALD